MAITKSIGISKDTAKKGKTHESITRASPVSSSNPSTSTKGNTRSKKRAYQTGGSDPQPAHCPKKACREPNPFVVDQKATLSSPMTKSLSNLKESPEKRTDIAEAPRTSSPTQQLLVEHNNAKQVDKEETFLHSQFQLKPSSSNELTRVRYSSCNPAIIEIAQVLTRNLEDNNTGNSKRAEGSASFDSSMPKTMVGKRNKTRSFEVTKSVANTKRNSKSTKNDEHVAPSARSSRGRVTTHLALDPPDIEEQQEDLDMSDGSSEGNEPANNPNENSRESTGMNRETAEDADQSSDESSDCNLESNEDVNWKPHQTENIVPVPTSYNRLKILAHRRVPDSDYEFDLLVKWRLVPYAVWHNEADLFKNNSRHRKKVVGYWSTVPGGREKECGGFWHINRIIDKRRILLGRRTRTEMLVEWLGSFDNTWKDISYVRDYAPQMLRDYERRRKIAALALQRDENS